jgi:hypothetical protein
VGKHVRPYIPLSENMSALEMYEGGTQILAGESTLSESHFRVERGA